MPFKRTAGVGGILFVAFALAGLVLTGDAPDPDAPPGVIARYYAQDAGQAQAASTLSAVALVPFAVFIAGLVTAVRAAEREQGEGWSIVGVVGTAVTATAVLASSGVNAALAIGARALGTAPALTGTLYDIHALMSLGLVALGLALTAGGFSMAGTRTRVLPPSLCSLGLIVSLLALIGGILSVESVQGSALGAIGFIAFLMFLVWSLFLAVSMTRRQPLATAGEPTPVQPAADQPPVLVEEATPALYHQG